METRRQRDARSLKAYSIVIPLLLAVIAFSAISQANQKKKFAQIDVERINIVEKVGEALSFTMNPRRAPT